MLAVVSCEECHVGWIRFGRRGTLKRDNDNDAEPAVDVAIKG